MKTHQEFTSDFRAWMQNKSIEWLMSIEHGHDLFKLFAEQTNLEYNFHNLIYYGRYCNKVRNSYIDSFLNIVTD